MWKNIAKIIAIFILGTIGGIFADQILWPYFIERPLFYKYRLEQPPVYMTEIKEITIQENTALTDAIEKVEKVVMRVKTKTKTGKILEGSGLIITSDGLLITLNELVPRGSSLDFVIEGKSVAFQILKRDLENNLALIKVEKGNLSTCGFADSERIKLGERVFLVGIVPGKEGYINTVNEGIVKSFDKDFITTNISEKTALKGSPLFDIEGQVLGLNTVNLEGEIEAIPISIIREFIGF